MVKTIKIKCPHCQEESELFLSINPTVIVLNCPDCWTPLMYDRHKIRILSEQEVNAIVPASVQPEISRQGNEGGEALSKEKKVSHRETEDQFYLENKIESIGHCERERVESITPDDILDLRIELAQCEDVMDFINRI